MAPSSMVAADMERWDSRYNTKWSELDMLREYVGHMTKRGMTSGFMPQATERELQLPLPVLGRNVAGAGLG